MLTTLLRSTTLLASSCRTEEELCRGFYFAFGHSTIVLIAACVAYWTASATEQHFEFLKDIGTIISWIASILIYRAKGYNRLESARVAPN